MSEASNKHETRRGWFGLLGGLAVLVVSLAFMPPFIEATSAFEPVKRLVWCGLLLFLVVSARAGRYQSLGLPWILMLVLLVWMVARTMFRNHPMVESVVLASWLLPLLMFVFASGNGISKRDVKVFGELLLLAGGVQAVLMLMQRAGADPLFWDTTVVLNYLPSRMIGTVGYHNQAAEFLVLSLAGLSLVGRIRAHHLAAACLVGVAMVLTANRGCILGFIVALGVLAILLCRVLKFRMNRKGAITLIVLVVAGATAFCFSETFSRFREIIVAPGKSLAFTTRAWMGRVGLDMLAERPLLGWGAGEYAYQYLVRLGDLLPAEKTNALLESVVFAREAHNDALQFAVEFGIPALILMVVGEILLFTMALRVIIRTRVQRSSKGPMARFEGSAYALGIVYILVFMTVASCFSFTWQTAVAGPLAGLLLGVFTSLLFGNTDAVSATAEDNSSLYAKANVFIAVPIAVFAVLLFASDFSSDLLFMKSLTDGRLDDAEMALSKFSYRQYALLGGAQAKVGKLDEAERSLRHSLEGYRDVHTFNNLGNVLYSKGDYEAALEYYALWARTGIMHSHSLINVAVTQERLGLLKEAVENRMTKHRLFPEKSSNDELFHTAMLLLKVGDIQRYSRLVGDFERRNKVAGSRTWTAEWENLAGVVCLYEKRTEAAEARFRQALKMKPDLLSAKRNLEGIENRRAAGKPAKAP